MDPLAVPARLESLRTIGAYVTRAAEAGGIDRRLAYRLRLAVDEIATNIVEHGRPGEHGNEVIVVKAAVDDESVSIVLEDEGPAFNPLERHRPVDLTNRPNEERRPGGLGLFLALRSVHRFQYDRVGAINRNTFTVHRRSPETGQRLTGAR